MSQHKCEAGETNKDEDEEKDSSWVVEVEGKITKFRQLKRPTKPSIFRVPPVVLSNKNLHAYVPKLVSIGPYHHGNPNLQAMEEIKWQILDHLLSESQICIRQCLKEMQELEEEARSHYSEVINMDSHKFAEMLLLDGCFIIQLFLPPELRAEELSDLLDNGIWLENRLYHDLLLLENQIPYFIFKHLIEVLSIQVPAELPLQDCILVTLKEVLPHLKVSISTDPNKEVDHLLRLLHDGILSTACEESSASPTGPQSPQVSSLREPEPKQDFNLRGGGNTRISRNPWEKDSEPQSTQKSTQAIPSVTELVDAGVKIKVSKDDKFLNISFINGVLQIPVIEVDDYTNLVFRNLIALEQCYSDIAMEITWYCVFMDSIINTERDVALLSQKGVIVRGLGSDMDIASIFNKFCQDVTIDYDKNYLDQLFTDVRTYCNSKWNRWRARLMRDYFSNPWAIISVIAAAVLLVLTVVQTVLSVLSYIQQINSSDRSRP